MAFIDEATPSKYRAVRMEVTRDGDGGIEVSFEMSLYNESGRGLTHKSWETDLTQGQLDTFLNFYQAKMTEFETETGLEPLTLG
jgi:hypothetical protein